MKPFLLTFFLVFLLHISLSAQNEPATISGTILDKGSNQPIPYATVIALEKDSKEMVTGTSTQDDGSFSFQSNTSNINVEVRFMGYETKIFSDFSTEKGKADLGTILLTANSQVLDDIKVVGEKSSMEFELDKRVFNVGKDISSTGMSALEVLNNVPSVNV